MLVASLVGILALGAAVAEAGLDKRFRAHSPHKRATLSLQKRASSTKHTCKLKTPTSSTSKAKHPTSTTSAVDGNPTTGGGNNGKTIQVTSPQCGAAKGTVDSTVGGGPNGLESWLNCGIDTDGGWNPPNVQVSDLITIDLATALKQPGTPFSACNDYLGFLNAAADANKVPAILLASIAMQESSCNPDSQGEGGEQGIMQISSDKCPGGQGGKACRDPETNINIGSKYFADTLNANGGNVVLTLGLYNGWVKGMTVADAEAAAKTKCCHCQNNLDYLQETFNGYVVNVDAQAVGMGTWQNLKICDT